MIKRTIIFFILNFVSSLSERALSPYGCYTTTGPLPPPFKLLKSTTPIRQVESENGNLNIICISLVKDAELNGSLSSGQTIDMSNSKDTPSLLLQKKEISTGLYSSRSEPVIISTCKRASVYAVSEPNTKLQQFQVFLVLICTEIVKYRKPVLRVPTTPEVSSTETDLSQLGMNIPFGKRPYECRFDSPTFVKTGNKINYKMKLIQWLCSSKTDKLLVLNVNNSNNVTEKVIISFASIINSPNERFVIKSPCNGTVVTNSQGVLNSSDIFLRIDCIEENIKITLQEDSLAGPGNKEDNK